MPQAGPDETSGTVQDRDVPSRLARRAVAARPALSPMPAPTTPTPRTKLHFARQSAVPSAVIDRCVLGRIYYGDNDVADAPAHADSDAGADALSALQVTVAAPRLLGRAPGDDQWSWSPSSDGSTDLPIGISSDVASDGSTHDPAGAATHRGQTGCVRWARTGDWLFGVIRWTAADESRGLAPLAERSYRDLFATLAEAGLPALQRVWNYLPRINAPGLDRERYQEFNVGRQQAFMAAGQSAFVGAPAACALGTADGGLTICFLAGREATVAIENPRQVSAYRYPARYGPSAPTFSRAALAALETGQLTLFISGTASIVGHESLHLGNTVAQVEEIVRNLESLIAAAQARSTAHFALADAWPVVYVRDPAEAPLIEQTLARLLGARSLFLQRAHFLQADICRHELRVEIEALAQAPGVILAN